MWDQQKDGGMEWNFIVYNDIRTIVPVPVKIPWRIWVINHLIQLTVISPQQNSMKTKPCVCLYSKNIWHCGIWQWTTRGRCYSIAQETQPHVQMSKTSLKCFNVKYHNNIYYHFYDASQFNCILYVLFMGKCNIVCPLQFKFYWVCIMWNVRTWWYQHSSIQVDKGTSLCTPLWCHTYYCCSIVMSCIENSTAIPLVEWSKLNTNINE